MSCFPWMPVTIFTAHDLKVFSSVDGTMITLYTRRRRSYAKRSLPFSIIIGMGQYHPYTKLCTCSCSKISYLSLPQPCLHPGERWNLDAGLIRDLISAAVSRPTERMTVETCSRGTEHESGAGGVAACIGTRPPRCVMVRMTCRRQSKTIKKISIRYLIIPCSPP